MCFQKIRLMRFLPWAARHGAKRVKSFNIFSRPRRQPCVITPNCALADSAALVSLDILHDGANNVANAVTDLMKERPKKTDGSGLEPLPEELERRLEGLDWVERAEVRLREDGHVFFGEAYIVPRGGPAEADQIASAVDYAKTLNWRLHDLTVMPVEQLPRERD